MLHSTLSRALRERILVLDGAMGSLIQQYNLSAEAFGGKAGCNDILSITAPDVIAEIHSRYIDAGADIISTNSFNANAISLAEYGLSDRVAEINLAASRLARAVADRSERKVWVAGSVGPSGKSLSMSRELSSSNWGARAWDEYVETYTTQIAALIEGGVDVLLLETQYDLLNTKAALWSAKRAMERVGREVDIIISATLSEGGRLLSGHTPEAFVAAVAHARPLAVGFNCGFGTEQMMHHVAALAEVPYAVSIYPNAGMPDDEGHYSDTPERMCQSVERILESQAVNIVGGCCGTTPDHIALIAAAARRHAPRPIPAADRDMVLCGRERLEVNATTGFINVGERCNVAGSRKFLRLVGEHNMAECVEIGAQQARAGARIIDINTDDAMIDAAAVMEELVCRMVADTTVGELPLMIDSSDFGVIERALKCIGGRPIVNSISLKNGEQEFVRRAQTIYDMGAVPVVMAFDEQGQATTFARRTEICARAYRILTERVGFAGYDIIFDSNILAVATGIPEHDSYAADFLAAVRWIKQNLAGAKVSGGVSNLSFSFRGNNTVREAMHSLFLYHAISMGMDMAIVNAAALPDVYDLPAGLRSAVEDVLFNRDSHATDRLVALASQIKRQAEMLPAQTAQTAQADAAPSEQPSLRELILKGNAAGLEQAVARALSECGSAIGVIEGELMGAMAEVGERFGQGALFLPQVVRSASIMREAVEILQPHIDKQSRQRHSPTRRAGKIVIATVKGDVHDIGKNIVGIVLACNGMEVIDLGVMVPPEVIVSQARRVGADAVGLSGLITPSLHEMCRVAELMEREGLDIPLFVGGAATSRLHTAVKIAPLYSGAVVYTRDAATLPPTIGRILSPTEGATALRELRAEQATLRESASADVPLTEYRKAFEERPRFQYSPQKPAQTGVIDFEPNPAEVARLINWRAFLVAWRAVRDDSESLRADAEAVVAEIVRDIKAGEGIRARVALLAATSDGADISIESAQGVVRLPMLRAQRPPYLSPADFIAPQGDYIGLFAVTVGSWITSRIEAFKGSGDDYHYLLWQTVADRLAEAATEWLHAKVKSELWHTLAIRPAFGYPSLPDQGLVRVAEAILDYGTMGITITENGALAPSSTTSGLLFAHPESRYFHIGEIGDDQRRDYAARRNMDMATLNHYLPR